MELRLSNLQEARICYQCIEDARAYHKSLGFEQWHPDYPTEQTILDKRIPSLIQSYKAVHSPQPVDTQAFGDLLFKPFAA